MNDKQLRDAINNKTILNTDKVINTNKTASDFIYNVNKIPTLKDAQGKIVLFTCKNFGVGVNVRIPNMGDCREYSNSNDERDGDICLPHVVGNIRVQDDYNLEKDDKWKIIYDTLKGNVGTMYDNTYYDKDDDLTTKFFDRNNENVLTINFMNMARLSHFLNPMD